jgi:hypothetical protein
MAKQSASGAGQDDPLATVARLVTAADGDTLYRDVYLRRAGELLAPIVTQAHYESALTSRDQLTSLLAQARAAVGRQDWAQVQELGNRAADLKHSLDTEQASLSAAETVYGAPVVALDPFSPGLTTSSKRWSGAAQARAEVSKALVELARDDPGAAQLYAARRSALEALAVSEAAAPGAPAGGVTTANVELHALQALEQGDAATLARLAGSMLGKRSEARPNGEHAAPAADGRIAVPAVLGEPLPEACLPRAAALGLERVEVTLATAALAEAVSDFVGRYALGASAATFDRAKDGVARVTVAAEKVDIPHDVAAIFAGTISLFALHLYANSAGVRYVPVPAPREALLVESHPEGEEPVTPLLRELGLQQRRGLSRDDLEAALWRHGARIVAEHLGLDPIAFRIVCVPPDVYVRVGRERGWGQRQEWTHFDGYQVVSGGRLRALVGGNARFGGLFDLCSISHDDGRENTVVRFAVVRRERLGVRIG